MLSIQDVLSTCLVSKWGQEEQEHSYVFTYFPLGSIREDTNVHTTSSHLQKSAPGAASSGRHWQAGLPTNLQRRIKLNDEGRRPGTTRAKDILTEAGRGVGRALH